MITKQDLRNIKIDLGGLITDFKNGKLGGENTNMNTEAINNLFGILSIMLEIIEGDK